MYCPWETRFFSTPVGNADIMKPVELWIIWSITGRRIVVYSENKTKPLHSSFNHRADDSHDGIDSSELMRRKNNIFSYRKRCRYSFYHKVRVHDVYFPTCTKRSYKILHIPEPGQISFGTRGIHPDGHAHARVEVFGPNRTLPRSSRKQSSWNLRFWNLADLLFRHSLVTCKNVPIENTFHTRINKIGWINKVSGRNIEINV